MATICYNNLYHSFSDRGAFVQKQPWQTSAVDEAELRVGERLPHWPSYIAPVVKRYDPGMSNFLQYIPATLELEYEGKTITLHPGDEVKLDSSFFNAEHGVECYILKCVKMVNTRPVYTGGWQLEDVILQRLRGPMGRGQVRYPNGDFFEGDFSLSYQSIDSQAYTACGRYTFADGSVIERAWVNTNPNGTCFDMQGLSRIKHPSGPDSIAMFCKGQRCGIELFLDEQKPYIREWCADKPVERKRPLELVEYDLDDSRAEDLLTLTLTLRGGDGLYRVVQRGGRIYQNHYDHYIYRPHTEVSVTLPDGDTLQDDCGEVLKQIIKTDS
ncbi:MAG: hypothetical protein IJ609_04980 [Paludibacteraceae bacterium]|nr:hypothetical protein [Paludibacteraceae bacterium]